MSARLRSRTRSGSVLVLVGLGMAAGCVPKGPARPHGILVSTPPALQTVLAIDKDGNQILAGSFTGRVTVAGTPAGKRKPRLEGSSGCPLIARSENGLSWRLAPTGVVGRFWVEK